jgi:dTDP-4-dehydrorhamnose 3,5-epimerase
VSGPHSICGRAFVTPLKRIKAPNGDVLHGMKASSPGYQGFGEAYFSNVAYQAVKGWKRHNLMTLNLIVIRGEIRFMVHDEATDLTQSFHLTPNRQENFARLTVAPGLWMAFGGIASGESTLLNIASIEHDPTEAQTRPLTDIAWHWADD